MRGAGASESCADLAPARFLSRLCFAGVIVGLLGIAVCRAVDPTYRLAWPLIATLAYLALGELARRGRVHTAGVLMVLWTTIAALSVGLLNHQLETTIAYVALALFVGCTVLPARLALGTGLLVNALALTAGLSSLAPTGLRFRSFVVTVVPGMTMLMLFIVHYRNRLERERRGRLEASERSLQLRNRYLAFQRGALLRLASASDADLTEAMRDVFQSASEALEARWVGLALLEPDQGVYQVKHAHPARGLETVLDPREMHAVCTALAEQRLVAIGRDAPRGRGGWELLRHVLLEPLGIAQALLSSVKLDGVTVAVLIIGDSLAADTADELLGHEQQAASLGDIVSAFIAAERRHQTERALVQAQKQEELALFMGGLAHDVNNMLSIVVAHAELLKVQPSVAPTAAKIRAAALRASDLVTNLLSFARPHGGHVEAVDLSAVLTTFAEFLKPLVGEDVAVVVRGLPAPVVVEIDRHQIEQIIINLATNARHAMPRGGRLLLQLDDVHYTESDVQRPTARPGRYVRLTVADTGCGIPAAVLARIWDPFFTTKSSGNGLGLATVQRLVHQAHGHIGVTSTPGEGTTFEIHLPVAHARAALPSRETVVAARFDGAHTVLVAEDEPALRELLEASFAQLGLRVVLAEDGERAVEAFREHADRISAVVLDVVMPRVGGPDALRRIRQQRRDVRAVLMSAYVPDEALSQMAGVAFLRKPFTSEMLAVTMADVLGPRRADPGP